MPMTATRNKFQARGFTLVEVLVALGIVAIALASGLQASAALLRNAERQSDVLLAQICAENQLISARLARQMPDVDEHHISCEQAGQVYDVVLTVQPTPNPSFRRLEAKVQKGESTLLRLSTVLGRY